MSKSSIIRTIFNYYSANSVPEKVYTVELFEHGEFRKLITLEDKSIHYAEDIAENWRTGILKLEDTHEET